MKRKQLANGIMAVIILVIAAAGFLTAAHIRGWLETDREDTAVLAQVRGIVWMERDGVTYAAEEDTVLRTGDRITCSVGATATISTAEGELILGEQGAAEIAAPRAEGFLAEVTKGEAFVNTKESLTLTFDGNRIIFSDTAAVLRVEKGSSAIGVFAGTVEEAEAGEILQWTNDGRTVRAFTLQELNTFELAQLNRIVKTRTLCFAQADLDRLSRGQSAAQNTASSAAAQETDCAETETTGNEQGGSSGQKEEAGTQASGPEQAASAAIPADSGQTEAKGNAQPGNGESAAPSESKPAETTLPLTCTIRIQCDTILENWEKLDAAKAGEVPADGLILSADVSFAEGETAFDVLKRACSEHGILLEYSWSPGYGSYYVEGIHNIYEFDCGPNSGWMYQVNGVFPEKGASGYNLSDGDQLIWCYTCGG